MVSKVCIAITNGFKFTSLQMICILGFQFSLCWKLFDNAFTLTSWKCLVLSYICVFLSPKLSNCTRLQFLSFKDQKLLCLHFHKRLHLADTDTSAIKISVLNREPINWEATESLTYLTTSACQHCWLWNVYSLSLSLSVSLSLCLSLSTAGNKGRKIL